MQQVGGDALRASFGHIDAEAAGDAPVVFDALAQLLNLLGAHARQSLEPSGVNGFSELVDAGDLAASQKSATVLGPMPGSFSSSSTPAP